MCVWPLPLRAPPTAHVRGVRVCVCVCMCVVCVCALHRTLHVSPMMPNADANAGVWPCTCSHAKAGHCWLAAGPFARAPH